MDRRVKIEKPDVTSSDLELSAPHAATTDPRSVESAAAIARRLWDQGVDTRVHRGCPDPWRLRIVLGNLGTRLEPAGVDTFLTTPTRLTLVKSWERSLAPQAQVPMARGGEVPAVHAKLLMVLP